MKSTPSLAPAASSCIGVFDSGSGGLSVLAALRRRLPAAALVYVGDLAHAPYGERDAAQVAARSQQIAAHLIERGARIIVVACNTATVLGITALRARWPRVAFVGVEPGVKPAASSTRNGRIAVMATPATAASERLRFLIDAYAADVRVHIAPCPGLASAIERDADDVPALRSVLAAPCAAIRAFEADTVVLGCTHYPFVAAAIEQLLVADVRLIDTAVAVAERTAAVWATLRQTTSEARPGQSVAARIAGPAEVFSTGSTAAMTALLRRCSEFAQVEVQPISI